MDPIQTGHFEVHLHPVEGLSAVASLADHFETGFQAEQQLEAVADDRLIVANNHAHRLASPLSADRAG